MNRLYRTVFNACLGQCQVASELTRSRATQASSGGANGVSRTFRPIGLLTLFCLSNLAWAAPGDGGNAGVNFRGNGGASGNGGSAYYGNPGDASSNGNGGNGAVGAVGTAGGTGGTVGTSPGYTGGAGSNGANATSSDAGGGGGGGGAGFFGLSGTWALSSATGGNGGNGGNSTGAHGGGGGGGGNGVSLSNGTLTNLGSISGGNGGNGGTGTINEYTGAGGGGGHGVSGANLNIINAGTISAGLGGLAATPFAGDGEDGAAVQFTGGTNSLTLQTGSQIDGVVWLMDNTNATITAENAGLTLGDGVLLGNGSALTVDTQEDLSIGAITGDGSLNKTGSSTLFLTGQNSYTGGTTVSAGRLLAGNAGVFSSSAAVMLASGATLDLNGFDQSIGSLAGTGTVSLSSATLTTGSDNTSTTFSGAIHGTGGLTKNGSGVLTLSGSSNYGGTTAINAGTLKAGSTGALASTSAFTLGSGTTLDLGNFNQSIASLAGNGTVALGSATLGVGANNSSTTFSGAINGTGGLTKNGTGTLTLIGLNGYTGLTTINAGTLQIGNGGVSGSIAGDILNNGALSFSHDSSTNYTYAFDISGSGALNKTDNNLLTLTGSNTYTGLTTLSAGTLQIGNGGTSGSLTGDVLNNSALVFNRADGSTYAGDISGSGTLAKLGAGKLVLEGISNIAGDTHVDGGSLIVGGSAGSSASLTSNVDVASGALLGGHGRITGNVDLVNGATLAPGNSIGTLSVDGDVTLAPGSTLEIEANPDGSSDRLVSTGVVSLGGASLNILAGAGSWASSTSYDIIQAASLNGTFGSVSSNLAFLTPELSYSATGVDLTLERNDISYASVAQTYNQRAVADAQESANGGSLYDAIEVLSAEQARAAYDSLSGEFHASTRGALFDDSRYVREAVTDRLRAGQSGLASGDVLHSDAESGLTFWLSGYGNWSDKDGNSNVADLDRNSRGTLIGLDLPLNQTWRLGVAAGYGTSDLDVSRRESSADIDSTILVAYLGGQWDALSLRLGVARTWSEVDSKRDLQVGALRETLKANYNADTTQVFGELGYALQLGELTLEPFVGLAHVEVDSDGFQEHGGTAALSGNSEDDSVDYATLGLRAATPLGDIAGLPLSLHTSLAWQHAFDEPSDESRLSLAGYDSFSVKGVPVAEDSALAQLGLGLQLSPQASVGLGYSGQFGDGNSDQGARLTLSTSF